MFPTSGGVGRWEGGRGATGGGGGEAEGESGRTRTGFSRLTYYIRLRSEALDVVSM